MMLKLAVARVTRGMLCIGNAFKCVGNFRSANKHGHKLYIRSRGRLHFFLHSSSAPRISLLAALYHSGHRHAITARRSTDCHRHTHSHTLSHTHTRTLTRARADTFHSCAEDVSVSPRLPSSMCSL